jgi:hypothetical protein
MLDVAWCFVEAFPQLDSLKTIPGLPVRPPFIEELKDASSEETAIETKGAFP